MVIRKEPGPDQARSWAIALAACVINTLLSGISRATGLFYVALIENYGVSRLQANLPFTVRNVVRNLAGPLVGVIGQRYGPRDVTIVGGIFASVGIVLCTFAPNVIWITALWGGVHGFGVSLANTLFGVVVNQYFLKYRATASGIALSGACCGSFVYPIVLSYMLGDLGLSGTFLITGGLVMHCLPAAIMLKEPPWIRKQKATSVAPSKKPAKAMNILSDIQEESNAIPKCTQIEVVQNCKEICSPVALELPEKKNVWSAPFTNGIDNPAYTGSTTDLDAKIGDDLTAEDIICSERLRTLSVGEASMTIPASTIGNSQEMSLHRSILHMSREPMFHMISLSLAAFSVLFDPAITVIVDYMMDKGLTEDVAKYFISMLALGDLIGRLGFGWVTDRNYLSVPKFMMLLQVIQGACFLLMPLCNGFNTLMTNVVIFGLMSGANLVMFPILVGKYLQSFQSLSIGCISFFSGILSFTIPPLIGYFRDRVGSYDGMFCITGGLSVVTGFLWLLEPLFLKIGRRFKHAHSASVVVSP